MFSVLQTRRTPLSFSVLAALFAIGCGEATNINGFMMSAPQKAAIDVLLFRAQKAYDQGDFETAEKLSDQAFEINPDNEEAAILSGYVNLSLAGVDAFQLAKNLIDKSSSSSSGNAGDALGPIATILGLTSTDVTSFLGDVQTSKATLFAKLPIVKPNCAEDARSKMDKLARVNKSIARICPFVKDAVRVALEPRHNATNCVPTKQSLRFVSKGNFLWAFSHLTEALAFYSVFSYSTTGDGIANLQGRVNAVSSFKPASLTEIQDLVAASTELATSVESVLPLPSAGGCAGKSNQMTSMLNDLKATTLGFANLPGVPEKLTKSITAAIDKVDQFSKNIPAADQALQAQSDALKGQLTKNIAAALGTKISQLKADNPNLSAADLSSLCSSFGSIAGAGTQTGQVTKPAECP